MALTEETKIDRMEILSDGQIQVREARIIRDDEQELSRKFRRYVLDPAITAEEEIAAQPEEVQRVVNAVWTQEVIDARKQALGLRVEPLVLN